MATTRYLPMGVNPTPLQEWDQLPKWQQLVLGSDFEHEEQKAKPSRDNNFTRSAYRPAAGSLRQCLESLMYLHNETVNIYSHLLGCVLIMTSLVYTYNQIFPRYPGAAIADVVVFATFFVGTALCFLLSATFHLVANHSRRVAAFGNQLDYLGIILLMWGSTVPTVYYGFYDDPRLQIRYWSVVSVLALSCAVTTFNPKFRRSAFRPYRAGMFAGLGLSALIFITHGITLYGLELQMKRMSLDRMALMALLNLIGASVYTARVPEKWWPRKFDIIGSSHQIFHITVVLAALVHFDGLIRAFDYLQIDNQFLR